MPSSLRAVLSNTYSFSIERHVAQEAERVGWSSEGCWFECGGVPERDSLTLPREELAVPCVADPCV